MSGAFLLLVDFVSRLAPEIIEAFFVEHPDLRPPPREGSQAAVERAAAQALADKFDNSDG